MARNHTKQRAEGKTLPHESGCWIKYQLGLRNITQNEVAAVAGLSDRSVSHFICGRKDSAKVRVALARVLGYPTFTRLLEASRRQFPGKGGAV